MTIRNALRATLAAAVLIGCLGGGGAARADGPPAPGATGAPSAAPVPGHALVGDDGQDIRDIHGPVGLPARPPVGWLAAGALALTALGAGLIYRHRRRPPLRPHERALRALEALRPSLGGDPRAFSFAVSEIVRTYVEASFSLPAAHRTTEELLADLMRDQSPVAAHRDALGTFLLHCDLAKFAGWSLTSSDMTALLDSAVSFVRATSAAPAAAPGQPPGGPHDERHEGSGPRMITLAHPHLLWLLALLPLLALLRSRKGPRAAVRYASVATARAVARTTRSRLGGLLPYLRLPAAALLIVALARPQVSHASTKVEASGVDMMLTLDVSGSMEALDLKLDGRRSDRLTVVKSVVSKFIAARPNDRMGIVAFAARPYLVSPLTLDHAWLEKSLERVTTGVGDDGTAIGSALAASVNRLRHSDARSKVIVLLTDGVNNAGSVQPLLAAKAAAALGIKVYTIAVGGTGRAPIPVVDDAGRKRIVMGEVDVDEATLRAIASTTGGAFFRATDTDSLVAIYQRIDGLEKTVRTLSKIDHREERFAWAALPGLALLLAEVGLGATALRRVP